MTTKNSFSDWKSVFRSNLPWNLEEFQRICSADWSSCCNSAGGWLRSVLAEMLIYSLVKSSRAEFFCVSFVNEKLTPLPSYLTHSVAIEKTMFCFPFTPERADFANWFVCWRAQVFWVEETRRSTWLPQALVDCLWSQYRSLSRALSAREESIPV